MPVTQADVPHRRILDFKYFAEWRWVDVQHSSNPAATAFGPPFDLQPGEQAPYTGMKSPKPVMYMPVKREAKQEIFPSLGIYITFWENGNLENVTVPAHNGAPVTVEVFNLWRGQRKGPVRLDGSLDARGRCWIKVPADTVKEWLNPGDAGANVLDGRINELLLDFSFACPSLAIDGQTLRGQSNNRVFLYRRKVIVFLPGAFGCQIKVNTPDGREVGFPDFYEEPSTLERVLDAMVPGRELHRRVATFLNQKVGGLECDSDGEPLLRPIKPEIFMLSKIPEAFRDGRVYDMFERCREARMRYFTGVPEKFTLVEVHVHAYDWRCDLTEAAKTLKEKLLLGQARLRKRPDTDDEVAVAGHSTGGLVIRRALGEDGMEDLVSHAFFMNVPFRGAPKALGVMLSGQDPPGGERMIPFIEAKSIRAIALSMPIVYHLAPSAMYPERVAITPMRGEGEPRSIETEKSELVGIAIRTGFLAAPQFVEGEGLSDQRRALLAANADLWHAFWAEATERKRAAALSPWDRDKREEWRHEQVRERELDAQDAARKDGSWNQMLAERARAFHEESEKIAASGQWGKKAYVFYSVSEVETTTRIVFKRDEVVAEHDSLPDLLAAEGLNIMQLHQGKAAPKRYETTQTLKNGRTVPALVAHEWVRRGDQFQQIGWRVYGEREVRAGDATVPTTSQIGFGGPATVFRALQGGPTHVLAPNAPEVWDRIMRTFQGRLRDDVDRDVDPVTGTRRQPTK